jgi:hypothetical protein
MDIRSMLASLREERAQVEEVILHLERLALRREVQRGRAPLAVPSIKKRGRPPGSKNRPAVLVNAAPPGRPQRVMAASQGGFQNDTA